MALKNFRQQMIAVNRESRGSMMKSVAFAIAGACMACASPLAIAQFQQRSSNAEELKTTQSSTSLAIVSQPLEGALQAFSAQSGLQVIFPTELARAFIAPALKGAYTPENALGTLLANTDLQFTFVNDRTVAIDAPKRRDKETDKNPHSADTREDPALPLALAQAQSPSPPTPTARISNTGDERSGINDGQDVERLDAVLVTGTHIRGSVAAGSSVLVIDREYIEKSGYSTVQDVLKTLPQNFNGGVGEDTGAADVSALNLNKGTAINLHGLGADSTLVLVNGRRQASGGLSGAFVDVSSIAASAVERIEVLTDGASSIYGSDAVGGVVNIILRDDFKGAESAARYGGYTGDANEWQVSQLLGHSWDRVHAMVAYQYQERDALAKTEFPYTVSADLTRFGGSDFRPIVSINSTPGNILDPVTFTPAYAIPAGQDGTALTPADLLPGITNFSEPSLASDLLPQQSTHAAFFNVSSQPTDRLELFAEGRFATRAMSQQSGGDVRQFAVPSTNPHFVDPFGGSDFVFVAYNFLNDLGPRVERSTTETYEAALGATESLGANWKLSVTGGYARETTSFVSFNSVNGGAFAAAINDTNPMTAFNAFGDGTGNSPATLDAIRSTQRSTADTDLWSANVIAEGPIFNAPGGVARLAVGADHREENLDTTALVTDFPDAFTSGGRDVDAVFAELTLPLVSERNARAAFRHLDLNLSARAENYSDFGSTTNPRVGVSWRPAAAFTIRGTWGTSFKAPRLIDLDESPSTTSASPNAAFILPVEDPASSVGFSNVLFQFGGNEDLQPEEATTWTLGFDIIPAALSDLSIGLTFSDIDYQDRIAVGGPPGNPTAILTQEALWSPLITRNPTAQQVNAICDSPVFLDFGLGSCDDLPTIADIRVRNLAAVKVRVLDLAVSHAIGITTGRISYGINASYFIDFKRQVTSGSPEFDVVDTFSNPPSLRLRGTLGWTHNTFSVDAFINYTGSYDDTFNPPGGEIDAWTTVDLDASYEFFAESGVLANTTLSVNVVNAFDEEPPFVNTVGGYDTANADLYGRIWSVRLKKAW